MLLAGNRNAQGGGHYTAIHQVVTKLAPKISEAKLHGIMHLAVGAKPLANLELEDISDDAAVVLSSADIPALEVLLKCRHAFKDSTVLEHVESIKGLVTMLAIARVQDGLQGIDVLHVALSCK